MGELFGRYRVFEQIGVGGMATVHRAETTIDGETMIVALKRLLPDLARDTSYVRRFVDEARLGQRLRHANIAKTFDVGCEGSTHYIAFEYVRGPTLLRLLQRAKHEHIPIYIALHVMTQVARALAYAHGLREENGEPLRLIHRDIAPSNIIISETGATKLIDFGVAKSSAAHVRTAVGSVIGKLGYVAPEYLRVNGQLDARVDLFSLGVVAYELLTMRKLFDVDDIRTAEHLRRCEIDPPSSLNPCVPPDLDDIVMTALERDPNNRWQNAFAMFTALSNLTHETGLAIHDRDVAEWVAKVNLAEPAETIEEPMLRTSEIELDVDQAFARISSRQSGSTTIPVLVTRS